MSAHSIYVDKFYVAQDEHEEIVFGLDLHDGMIVLVEDSHMREEPPRPGRDDVGARYQQARADECSRWCEVTRLHIVDRGEYGPLIKFVGKYSDGSSRVRSYAASYAWIVKRESM